MSDNKKNSARAAIHITPMAYFNDKHDQLPVANFVKHSKIADSNSPTIIRSNKFYRACGAWVVGQGFHANQNAVLVTRLQAGKLLLSA